MKKKIGVKIVAVLIAATLAFFPLKAETANGINEIRQEDAKENGAEEQRPKLASWKKVAIIAAVVVVAVVGLGFAWRFARRTPAPVQEPEPNNLIPINIDHLIPVFPSIPINMPSLPNEKISDNKPENDYLYEKAIAFIKSARENTDGMEYALPIQHRLYRKSLRFVMGYIKKYCFIIPFYNEYLNLYNAELANYPCNIY